MSTRVNGISSDVKFWGGAGAAIEQELLVAGLDEDAGAGLSPARERRPGAQERDADLVFGEGLAGIEVLARHVGIPPG